MFPKAPQYISPEALAMIRGIYDEITQMSWFPGNESDREQFAIDLLSYYEGGMIERSALRHHAWRQAEKHYGYRATVVRNTTAEIAPGM